MPCTGQLLLSRRPAGRCKGASALEHKTMRLRSFRSCRPTVRFYYPSWTIINCHQLVASLFINTILPCSPPSHTFLSFTTILSCTSLLFSPQNVILLRRRRLPSITSSPLTASRL